MGIQVQSWWMNLIRGIFGFLDQIIYGLIKWILFGVFDLSKLSTNSDVFNGIYQRIYVVLGIFMAFKLTFSFFQYIIDPDSMGDKGEKGVGKLFQRVFIMLFALIALPSFLFGSSGQKGLLSRAQDAFLPTLPRLIFGDSEYGGTFSSSDVSSTLETTSEEIATATLSGFFAPPEDLDHYCGNGTLSNTPKIQSLADFANNINTSCSKFNISLGPLDIIGSKYYKYSYMVFVSSVVGILVAALLLGITIDIAKRIFKLIILEVIAPIPIMSLIDPKGSKDGAFSKWIHSLIKTFLDIFLKLGLVYLIVVLIHMIVAAGDDGGIFTNFPEENGFRSTYLTILLILGLIFFAKEAPKFIKDAIGIKDSGGGLFDDVKTLGKAAGLVGGAAVGAAGIIGSGIASGRASYMADTENGKEHNGLRIAKNIGAGLLGAGAGAGTAVKALTGKNAGIGAVMKAQNERNTRVLNAGAAGSTWLGRQGSSISNAMFGSTEATGIAQAISANDSKSAIMKNILDRASSEMVKSDNSSGSFKNLFSGSKFNYKSVNAEYEAAKTAGRNSFDIVDTGGTTHTVNMSDYEREKGTLLTDNEADYIANGGFGGDSTLEYYIEQANNLTYTTTDASGHKVEHTIDTTSPAGRAGLRKALKDGQSDINIENAKLKRRQSKAKANDRYSAKK